ncbi:MAG: hypothetical protein A3H42_05255 [Deltaproteobacteria bacterium RIFCSPLOWO2_02_FULL_46_8]|nr:MAG: hypothetical protein A3H42_05255 [Deltaproteobacteria bacterium RIFCSPLOWO2_02_FULL_46_8]
MSPLSFATGNHHLFLILKTAIGEDWIVLLGKRKPNFPFAKTRFENATFYNVTQNKLHHLASEELNSLEIKMDGNWQVTAKEPIPFSIVLHPTFLQTRKFFLKKIIPSVSKHVPGAMFDHHLLNLFFQQGEIAGASIVSGHGFSEQGCLSILNLKSFEMPFHYNVFLEKEGDSGFLEWHVPLQKGLSPMVKLANIIRKFFLKDRYNWGSHPFNPDSFKQEVLTATHIPLNHWTLRREIVKVTGANKNVYYGLKESFVGLKKV